MGTTRHTWVTNTLHEQPIDRVQFIRKSNDEYMRGMKIHYRDGTSQVINSDSGEDAGTFQFEQGDMLIGLNMKCTSPSDKRPRQLGFILLRGGLIFETEMYGNSISKYTQVWPTIESLQGRQDAETLRITKISWSKWGSGDDDLSGIRLHTASSESEQLGAERYNW